MREDGEIVVPSHGNGHNFHFRIALDGLDELFHDRRKGQTVRAGVGEEVMNDDRLFGEFQRRTHLDVVFAENGIRSGSEKRTGKAGRANGAAKSEPEKPAAPTAAAEEIRSRREIMVDSPCLLRKFSWVDA